MVVTLTASTRAHAAPDPQGGTRATRLYDLGVGAPWCDPDAAVPHHCQASDGSYVDDVVSWDAWALRPPLPRLSAKLLPDSVFMNQLGAENRAGLAMLQANATGSWPPGENRHLRSGCGYVNWWHFHCTTKTHHVTDGATGAAARVDYPLSSWTRDFPGLAGSTMGIVREKSTLVTYSRPCTGRAEYPRPKLVSPAGQVVAPPPTSTAVRDWATCAPGTGHS